MIGELRDMHTYCRPAGSTTERDFIARYIQPLPGAYRDTHGNWHVSIEPHGGVLWSCHTDTVHSHPGRQRIYVSPSGRLEVRYRDRRRSSCLGADDTAGVFLCRQLILAGIPGWYIFHYGEERGCIGSQSLADSNGHWLSEQFRMAIALDRAGTSDVITHQIGGRSASNVFATALAGQLNRHRLHYKPCRHGIYTDTASYTDQIAECTNLSVGYDGAHHSSETLDSDHVFRLLDALMDLQPSTLPVDRLPGDDGRDDPDSPDRHWKSWRWNDDWRFRDDPQSSTASRYLPGDFADSQSAISDTLDADDRAWIEQYKRSHRIQ